MILTICFLSFEKSLFLFSLEINLMKASFEENEIREVVRRVANQIKRKFKPIAIIQFGSPLHPENMMIESDVDLMVILRKRAKDPIETFLFDGIEVEAHLISKKRFC